MPDDPFARGDLARCESSILLIRMSVDARSVDSRALCLKALQYLSHDVPPKNDFRVLIQHNDMNKLIQY